MFVDTGRWTEASNAFESAINLLSKLSTRTLNRTDQQYVLSQISGLSSAAAAAALEAEQGAPHALKLLEAGRCVILGLAIDTRSDVSDLKERDANLWEQYERCRDDISQLRNWQRLSDKMEFLSEQEELEKSLSKLASVESKIRQVPGLERFQLPLEPHELMELADKGPVVTFNISKIRCDAIMVTSDKIQVCNLPNLNYDTVHEKARSISSLVSTSRRHVKLKIQKHSESSDKDKLRQDLMWLWDSAVRPVLDKLDIRLLENVWWVVGGNMGLLPIHAAGDHSEGSRENTMSRTVSSYISTFKALRYSRERALRQSLKDRLMLVNMANTPGQEALVTKHEINAIREEFGEAVTFLDHPGKYDVLKNLKLCPFAHFACHGASNAHDPSEGGILLVENGRTVLLKIKELDGIRLKHANIAYLSACSTAELSAGNLVDEAIHLSNSFQMIGFKHVIGTMWAADDQAAGEIAHNFYRSLRDKFTGKENDELHVARVLHNAVIKFKNSSSLKGDVAQWGAFIHIGA
ncbi:hypothetical protein ABKA04_009901 [Annulohypoxylon sp. FPYF3050]